MPEGAADTGNVFAVYTCAAHADDVDGVDDAAGCGHAEGGNVCGDGGKPADERQAADTAELVEASVAAQGCVLEDSAMAAQNRAVDQGNIIMHAGIVTNVALGHHKNFVAQSGWDIGFAGGVYGDILAEEAIAADENACGSIAEAELDILRWKADAGTRKELGSVADSERAQEGYVRDERDMFADSDGAGDGAEGADGGGGIYAGQGVDLGGWMDRGHGP